METRRIFWDGDLLMSDDEIMYLTARFLQVLIIVLAVVVFGNLIWETVL